MDNLLEILIPILFIAIYFVSNLLGNKSGEGESPEAGGEEDFRKIREELRRKIEERRKGNRQEQPSQSQEVPASVQRQQPARGGAVLRESQPHRRMEERRANRPSSQREQVEAPALKAESTIQRDLEFQMEEVRRSKEKADAARLEASQKVAAIGRVAERRSSKSPASYRQFLREALNDPENLQKSFILHEVFGTPVGARREGQMRPSWDL